MKRKEEQKLKSVSGAVRAKNASKEIQSLAPSIMNNIKPEDLSSFEDIKGIAMQALYRALADSSYPASKGKLALDVLRECPGMSAPKKHVHLGIIGSLPPQMTKALFGLDAQPGVLDLEESEE